MSGQDAIRGFAVQTLICLLDALRTEGPTWEAVTLEPDIAGDKVDILWEYDTFTVAQQVKSSKNQIGLAAVEQWCRELKKSKSADKYELILAGPIAAAVLDKSPFNDVDVPTPTSMDTLALIDQAITKLDRYLSARAYAPIPLVMREAMISSISARLLDGSIRATRFTRQIFDGWLQESILIAYPLAIEQRLSANCDVIWNSIQISGSRTVDNQAFSLVVPITVINGGPSVAVVEWMILRVSSQSKKMMYRATSVAFDGGGSTGLHGPNSYTSSEFAVNPGNALFVRVAFTNVEKAGFESGIWTEGLNTLDLWIKYAGLGVPRRVKSRSVSISIDDRVVLNSEATKIIPLTSVGDFIEEL